MQLFDLHCDTLFESIKHNKSLYNNNFHVSFSNGNIYKNWFECFAIWIPDNISLQKSQELFENAYKKLINEVTLNKEKVLHCKTKEDIKKAFNNNKIGTIFTVENSSVCGKDLKYLYKMSKYGVKIITLTWNGTNYVGDGSLIENSKGLTAFGKSFINEMNKLNITIDLSHASDKLFYDVINLSSKPVIATHSNSRVVCSNKRNITDDQFKAIKDKNGIVGINFCKYFLNSNKNATLSDVLKHIEHFLSIGGQKNLCIGSDFDGTDLPDGISDIASMENLYEYLLKNNYNENIIKDIFFNNAYNFALNNF